MAPEKVTVMILDVDLKCSCCYKKVKKVLQIRDQVFDEDKNNVRITVVCCNPEKIRDKLCCKGGKAIQRIEIVEEKPKEPPKPKEPEKIMPVVKPKEPEKPKDPEKPKQLEKKPSVKLDKPDPMPGCTQPVYPPMFPVPVCCPDCYEGRSGGPCEYGYGRPPPGPSEYGYGRPVPPPPGPCYDGYGYQYDGNRGCYVSRCDYYFSEENPQGCSIM